MNKFDIEEMLLSISNESRSFLMEDEGKKLLSSYGIPTNVVYRTKTKIHAVEIAEKIGYPVVLKVLSPYIIHKSNVGGVRLNLNTAQEVEEAYEQILKNAKKIDENAIISVQKMAQPGTEVIVGTIKHDIFGQLIMFGLGGVLTELYEDVSFRLIPINERDAKDMINSVKASSLLKGYRGNSPGDIESLIKVLLKVSNIIQDFPIIKEIDINPLIVYEKGLVAVDARILIEDNN